TRSTNDRASAQDRESGIAHPILTPVLAPEITSTSHAALVKWRKERTVYEDIMRARCQTSKEDFDAVTRSVKDSFDRKLLETWCRLRWQIAVDDVDDDRLRTEIDGIINSVKNHTLPDVQALFKKNLHLNLKESDISERVLQYFISCEHIIEEHGLHACFESEAGLKEKCSLLINSITPEALKEEVKNALRYQSPGAKSDEYQLHNLILEKAFEQDREFRRSKRKRGSDDVQLQRLSQKRDEKKSKRKIDSERDSSGNKTASHKAETTSGKQPRADTKKKLPAVPDKG
ncbi:hypothetical protein F442_21422, partial [Phytophthora nicotianae P10297]